MVRGFAGGGLARPVSVPVAAFILLTKIPIVLYYGDNRRRPSSSLGGTSGGRSWAGRGCGAMC